MNFRMSNSKVGRFLTVAVVCCFISIIVTSCSVKRYIDEGERLVKDHELVFDKVICLSMNVSTYLTS